MLQVHFTEHGTEDVLEGDDAGLLAARAEDDGEALAAALEALEGVFEAEVFAEVDGGLEALAGGAFGEGFGAVELMFEADDADDAALATLLVPDREAGELMLAAELEDFGHGGLGVDGDDLGPGDGEVVKGEVLEVEDAIDELAFLFAEGLGGFLHKGAEFGAVAEEVAGEGLAAGPAEEAVGEAGQERDERGEEGVEEAKGGDGKEAEAVGEELEEHFGEQVEEGVEQEDGEDEGGEEGYRVLFEPAVKGDDRDGDDNEVGEGVAYEDGPEKVLGLVEVAVEHAGAGVAFAHHVADAEAAEGEDAGLHAGEEEGHAEAGGEQEGDQAGVGHVRFPLSCARG